MNFNINIFLVIIIFSLYYAQYKISAFKRHRVKKIVTRYSDLISVVEKLSFDMNNQSIDVYYEHEQLIKMVKYQTDNKWGIKIILDLNNDLQVYEYVTSKLSNHKIKYSNSIKDNVPIIEIDIKNNLAEGIKIIEVIFFKIFQLEIKKKLLIVYLRKSIFV